MITITTTAADMVAALKSAIVTVAKGDTRYALNGVHLTYTPEAGLVFVSSDTHCLTARRVDPGTVQYEGATDQPLAMTIPTADCKALIQLFKVTKKDAARHAVSITLGNDHGAWQGATFTGRKLAEGKRYEATPIDGQFPRWLDVLPRGTDALAPSHKGQAIPLAIDPHYLARAGKVFHDTRPADGQSVRVSGGQDDHPIRLETDDTILIIMPIKSRDGNGKGTEASFDPRPAAEASFDHATDTRADTATEAEADTATEAEADTATEAEAEADTATEAEAEADTATEAEATGGAAGAARLATDAAAEVKALAEANAAARAEADRKARAEAWKRQLAEAEAAALGI